MNLKTRYDIEVGKNKLENRLAKEVHIYAAVQIIDERRYIMQFPGGLNEFVKASNLIWDGCYSIEENLIVLVFASAEYSNKSGRTVSCDSQIFNNPFSFGGKMTEIVRHLTQ